MYYTQTKSELFSEVTFPTGEARLGIFLDQKQVIFTSIEKIRIGHVIHEMAHVFASKEAPKDYDEYQFFGWEYLVARHVGYSIRNWVGASWD